METLTGSSNVGIDVIALSVCIHVHVWLMLKTQGLPSPPVPIWEEQSDAAELAWEAGCLQNWDRFWPPPDKPGTTGAYNHLAIVSPSCYTIHRAVMFGQLR